MKKVVRLYIFLSDESCMTATMHHSSQKPRKYSALSLWYVEGGSKQEQKRAEG